MSERKLTRNEGLVLDLLREGEAPRTAYELLDGLRQEGLRAPPQVYRALHALCERRLVHRLESLNAFVACSHDHGHDHRSLVFMICERCSCVVERHEPELEETVARLAGREGFSLLSAITELRGLCSNCSKADTAPNPA